MKNKSKAVTTIGMWLFASLTAFSSEPINSVFLGFFALVATIFIWTYE